MQVDYLRNYWINEQRELLFLVAIFFFDKFLCASINARKRNLLIFYDSCGKHMFVLQKIISMKINCSFQGERGVREKTSEKYNGRIEYPF